MSMDELTTSYHRLFNGGDPQGMRFAQALDTLINTYVEHHSQTPLGAIRARRDAIHHATTVLNNTAPTAYGTKDGKAHTIFCLQEDSTNKGVALTFLDGLMSGFIGHYQTTGHDRPILQAINDIGTAWYDIRRAYAEDAR